LIFISQTPDYITPCTAAILQHQLGLGTDCLAFDINLGCSAYPYGLSVMAGLLQNMTAGKGLLLVGDKSSQLVAEKDKSAALLFSDAGSATALECDATASPMWFDLCTDGGGASSLMVKGGAGRFPFHQGSLEETEESPGIVRNELNLIIKGLDIFKFSVTRVPVSIRNLSAAAGIPLDEISYFVLHQANKLINRTIGKKLALPKDKMPETLHELGNASSASIPVTMAAKLSDALATRKHTLLLSGFGVGLSWGTAIVHTKDLKMLPLMEIE
jgi:3-oxoacyl-[acyl-carrier-protein] synthase-3